MSSKIEIKSNEIGITLRCAEQTVETHIVCYGIVVSNAVDWAKVVELITTTPHMHTADQVTDTAMQKSQNTINAEVMAEIAKNRKLAKAGIVL